MVCEGVFFFYSIIFRDPPSAEHAQSIAFLILQIKMLFTLLNLNNVKFIFHIFLADTEVHP